MVYRWPSKMAACQEHLPQASRRARAASPFFRVRCQRGLSFIAAPKNHLIWFPTSPQVRYECRMAGQAVDHVPPAGKLGDTPPRSESTGGALGEIQPTLPFVAPRHVAHVDAHG